MTDITNTPPDSGIEQIDEAVGATSITDTTQVATPDPVDTPAASAEPVAETTPATAAPTDSADVDDKFTWPAPTPLNNATTDKEYFTPIAEDKWDDLATIIALPPDTGARTMNYGATNPHGQDLVTTDKGIEWADTISEGLDNGSFHDSLLAATKREGAQWQQQIMSDAQRPLSIAEPRLGEDNGPLLTGERAMLRVNALMGRGSIMSIPLWHSGFWLTLKKPGEIDLLDTLQTISENKIVFGRSSNGLAFANHTVVSQGAVFDLAMRNLYETSVNGFNTVEVIRANISALDIPIIAWGLACALYPRGFQFKRALLDANGTQSKVVQELLNVGTCLRVDSSSLNDWQIKHMSQRRTASMSPESLKIYREHFTRGKPKSIMLNAKVGVTMRVPTVDEYLNAGQRWVDELVFAVNQAFTQDLSEKQRNDMIFDRAKATSMRQYVHWIESIDLPDPKQQGKDQAIRDVTTIENTISSLSGDDATRAKYYETVQGYINDAVVALIGVPQVHPEEADQVKPRFENIIPLDPVSVFTNLLYQKTQQIQQRP
jgi:hypothetical protein